MLISFRGECSKDGGKQTTSDSRVNNKSLKKNKPAKRYENPEFNKIKISSII
jgi:hypothetical protein